MFFINRRRFFAALSSLFSGLFSARLVRAEWKPFDFDSFDDLKPSGIEYQWCVEKVMGEVHLGQISQMLRQGWENVPADRHRDTFYIPGDRIEYGGCVLMQRPVGMVVKARKRETDRASSMMEELARAMRADGFEVALRQTDLTIDDSPFGRPRLEPSDDPKWSGWESDDDRPA